jgi:protein-S-isoprenylcysteine O-methyltransferase Ste14
MTEHRPKLDLATRAWRASVLFLVALWLLIMLPAGTLTYWHGWLLWLHLSFWTVFATSHLLKHDAALVERRLRAGPAAESEPAQKRLQLLISVALCAMLVVSALDWRFGWSEVPWPLAVAGHVVLALSYVLILAVLRANSFAGATVGVEPGQTVISSGPYSYVRHPMYTAALALFAAIPLALGSLWGLLPAVALAGGIVARLRHEETFLARNLAGYEAYRQRVRWRLVPGLW